MPDILKGQMAVAAGPQGLVVDATGLQIPGVLDDLYTYTGALGRDLERQHSHGRSLGAHGQVRQSPPVRHLHLDPGRPDHPHDPRRQGRVERHGRSCLEEQVLPVRRRGLRQQHRQGRAQRGHRPVLAWPVDELHAAACSWTSTIPPSSPSAWGTVAKLPLAAPEDIKLYELHVRDFSINDTTVPEARRAARSRLLPIRAAMAWCISRHWLMPV